MRVVIFGGRDFDNVTKMAASLNMLTTGGFLNQEDLILLCGMARGADMVGHSIFTQLKLPIFEYPADWIAQPRIAGFIRNTQMAKDCDVGVGFWDGKSNGTKHMIEQMAKLNKPTVIFTY